MLNQNCTTTLQNHILRFLFFSGNLKNVIHVQIYLCRIYSRTKHYLIGLKSTWQIRLPTTKDILWVRSSRKFGFQSIVLINQAKLQFTRFDILFHGRKNKSQDEQTNCRRYSSSGMQHLHVWLQDFCLFIHTIIMQLSFQRLVFFFFTVCIEHSLSLYFTCLLSVNEKDA